MRAQRTLLERGFAVALRGRAHNMPKSNPPLCVSAVDCAALLKAADATKDGSGSPEGELGPEMLELCRVDA